MIHYHGTPITPRSALHQLAGRNLCVSFAHPNDLDWCLEHGQSVMLDNGAFSAWTRGRSVDLRAYAEWVSPVIDARCHWAVIPDVIDGTVEENDQLLREWFQYRLPYRQCAPVWHMHEPLDRLRRLCHGYHKVCIGSSGQYRQPGSPGWHRRMEQAMNAVCGNGPAPTWLHMLRAAREASMGIYPFASTDSTNVARNHAGNNQGRQRKDAARMADTIDSRQSPARWRVHEQLEFA